MRQGTCSICAKERPHWRLTELAAAVQWETFSPLKVLRAHRAHQQRLQRASCQGFSRRAQVLQRALDRCNERRATNANARGLVAARSEAQFPTLGGRQIVAHGRKTQDTSVRSELSSRQKVPAKPQHRRHCCRGPFTNWHGFAQFLNLPEATTVFSSKAKGPSAQPNLKRCLF